MKKTCCYLLGGLILIVSIAACQSKTYSTPHVLIDTEYGEIIVEIYADKAPKTAEAFLKNVDKKVYNEASFYRVLKDESLTEQYNTGLIQGGVFNTDTTEAGSPFIPHESPKQTGLSHTSGTISMARTTPGTARTEFFICIGDQTQFDSSLRTNPDGLGYATFGKVVEGMPVVRKIQAQKNDADKIRYPVMIKKISRL